MPKLANYIEDTNRFHLAGPPQSFLRALWDLDKSLAIVPSRQDMVYRLCQRRQLTLPMHVTNEALFASSDTRMLATYGLVPVTTILATANWGNPFLIEQIKQMAPWRQGGADKVADRMEAQEAAEEAARRAKTSALLDDVTKDAWKYYNLKLGTRTSMFSAKTPSHSTSRPASAAVRTAQKTSHTPSVSTLFTP